MQTTAALSVLSIDSSNIRKVGRGSEPQFVATIRAKGIIEPLIVRANGKGFKVSNGGKRLASLEWMRDHGETANGVPVTDDYQVPIVIREEGDAAARETSLITAVCRVPAHPVDQFEAFAELASKPPKMSADDIAAHFGITRRQVDQALALGALSEKVREGWRDNKISASGARAFTLAPDIKTQDRILAKLIKGCEDHSNVIDAYEVKEEIDVKGSKVGPLVQFVGVDAYEKRGGKVTRDLFGIEHMVSNEKLAKAMAAEKVETECKNLVAAGWSFAIPSENVRHQEWQYGRINAEAKPIAENEAEQSRLQAVLDAEGGDGDRNVDFEDMSPPAQDACRQLEELERGIKARAFTLEQRAKSGCFVGISNIGTLQIDYGRVKPAEKRKVEAQERAKAKPKKKGAGEKAEPEVSAALEQRLSVTLTQAAAKAIASDPDLALTFALAGLLSSGCGGSVVQLKNDGMGSRAQDRDLEFDAAYKLVSKKPAKERMQLLAQQVGAAFTLDCRELADKADKKAEAGETPIVADAIDGRTLNKALRDGFDAEDYFAGVSKELIAQAVSEAIGGPGNNYPDKVRDMTKANAVAFAVANVPKTGWLPPQLRTRHYDGPVKAAKKAAPAKSAKKKRVA